MRLKEEIELEARKDKDNHIKILVPRITIRTHDHDPIDN